MTYIYNIRSSYLDNQMLYLGCASINQNTGKLIAPHLIYRLCTLWFQDDSLCIKRFLSFGCEDAKNKQQIHRKKKQDMSWTTMCCKHTSYGHSLDDVFTSNNTLWMTTRPAQCHLSFIRENRQEPSQPNVSLV